MDDDVEAALARLARSQHGLITRRQALAAGFTHHRIVHRLQTGRWEPRAYGVYALTSAPESFAQSVLAACLSARHRVFAAGRTAATLLGLGTVHPGRRIELAGHHQVRIAGARVRRTAWLPSDHVMQVDGIPVTTAGRTLFDLAAILPARVLEASIDEALRLRITTVEALGRVLSSLEGARLPGTDRFRCAVMARHPEEAPVDSVLERRALRTLKRAGLPRPVLQYAVPFPDRTYHLDFAWPDALLALEVDGWDGHRMRGRFDRDRERLNRLQAAGWLVLHYTSRMDADLLVRPVRIALASRRSRGECKSLG